MPFCKANNQIKNHRDAGRRTSQAPSLAHKNKLIPRVGFSASPIRMSVNRSGSGIIEAPGNLALAAAFGKLPERHLRLRYTSRRYDSESLLQAMLTGD